MSEPAPLFVGPSGYKFFRPDIEIVQAFHELGIVKYLDEPLPLNAGGVSRVYVSTRNELTEHPELLRLMGRRVLEVVQAEQMRSAKSNDGRQVCFIGVPVAGTALAAAGAFESIIRESLVPRRKTACFRLMREKRKKHGVHRYWVDGLPEPERHRYWVLDNTATSSRSMLLAIQRLRSDKYPVRELDYLLLFDRQQGAVENLQRLGYRVHVIFKLLDILACYVHLGRWTEDQYREIKAEIYDNQFTIEQAA